MFMYLWKNMQTGHKVCMFNVLMNTLLKPWHAHNMYTMQFKLKLTIVIRGVAVSGTGVSQRSEVGHHVSGWPAVHRWPGCQQDHEVKELEDVWAGLVDREQNQSVPLGQPRQGDDQVMGCEAVQTRCGLIQDKDTFIRVKTKKWSVI